MADYKVTDTELTSIANAIRTKGGTQAQLEFPAGFVSAVQAIPTGGGGVIQPLSVTMNGTYTPPSGVDGYGPVTVNVSGGITLTRRDYAKFAGASLKGVILPFLFDENTGVEIEFMINSTRWQQIYGTWDTSVVGNITWNRATNDNNAAGTLYIGDGTNYGQSNNNVSNLFNVKHKITTNVNGHSYVDDTIEFSYTPTAPGRDIPLVIGGNRMTGSAGSYAYFDGRIYSYKLFNRSTGVQIANIYPVTFSINSPSVQLDALYDSINNGLYFGGASENSFTCADDE